MPDIDLRVLLVGATALMVMQPFVLANEAGAYDPRWMWEVGQTRVFELQIERRQSTSAARAYSATLKLKGDLRLTALDCASSETVLSAGFDNLRLEHHAGKIHALFDSKSSTNNSSETIWAVAGRTLIASECKVAQSATGEMRIIVGFDEHLSTALKPMRAQHPREFFILEQLFSDRGLDQLLNNLFHLLPEKGEASLPTWRQSKEVELGFGVAVRRVLEFKTGKPRSAGLLPLELTGWIEPLADSGDAIALPGGSAAVELGENSISGRGIFSTQTGSLAELLVEGRLRMLIKLRADTESSVENDTSSQLMQKTSARLTFYRDSFLLPMSNACPNRTLEDAPRRGFQRYGSGRCCLPSCLTIICKTQVPSRCRRLRRLHSW